MATTKEYCLEGGGDFRFNFDGAGDVRCASLVAYVLPPLAALLFYPLWLMSLFATIATTALFKPSSLTKLLDTVFRSASSSSSSSSSSAVP